MITVLAYIAAIFAIVVFVGGVFLLIRLDWQAVVFGLSLLAIVYAGVWGATTLGWLPTS